MHDSRIENPSVIYLVMQPFYCCIIYVTRDSDQWVTYICLPFVSSKQSKEMNLMNVYAVALI